MEVGPTTHYIMGGVRVDGDTQMSTRAGAVRRRRVRRGHPRREPARRQLAVRPARVRQARRRVRGGCSRRANGAVTRRRRGRSRPRPARALEPFERGAARREPVQGPARAAGDDAGPRRHRAHRRARCSRRSTGLEALNAARRAGRRDRQPRVQPGLAHGARPRQPADGLRGDRALARSSARRAAAGTSARTIRTRIPRSRRSTSSCSRARRRDAGLARADPADAGRVEAGHRGEQVSAPRCSSRARD